MKRSESKRRIVSLALCAGLLLSQAGVAGAAKKRGTDVPVWPQFLGMEASQGLSAAETPTSAENLKLRWEKNTGHTWQDVPGTPIVVGDYVYYYSSQYLRKLDLKTGEELAKAQIYQEPVNQFFINIAYGEGKIFVPCQKEWKEDGTVANSAFFRVFDADTLQQLYVTESLGAAQMQAPVIYHDGYFVTGTYTGRDGVYACFTAEDENSRSDSEVKKAKWIIDTNVSAPAEEQKKFTFSWDGATFIKDYCYFAGGDTLWQVKYRTGETVSMTIGGFCCSTLVYHEELNRLYVAANSEPGASVTSYGVNGDGTVNLADRRVWKSTVEGGGTQSSPVIYNGRLYIGGGGYTMGSAEPFHVIDAETMEEIYSVPLRTKGSASISTAYATEQNGNQVYIYMVPYAPVENQSQMWIIKDSENQTKADYEVISGIGHSQYCSQSVAIAADGALIWYNDGGYLYCYENAKASSATGEKEPKTAHFNDVDGRWSEKAIYALVEQGVFSGTGKDSFSPRMSLTRGQLVQILYNKEGKPAVEGGADRFTDVVNGAWYQNAVAWAAEQGLVTGSKDGSGQWRFRPNDFVTRQDLAVILNNYVAKVMKRELDRETQSVQFIDEAQISAYAKEAVGRLADAKIVSGASAGEGRYRFHPKGVATREETAAILYKLI